MRLIVTIETNLTIIDFIDVTLDLSSGIYRSNHKPD